MEGRAKFSATRQRCASPGREHDQRGPLAQMIVEPRQAIDRMNGAAELRLEKQEHALKYRSRHGKRPHRGRERLATAIIHDLRSDPRRQDETFAEFESKIFDVG